MSTPEGRNLGMLSLPDHQTGVFFVGVEEAAYMETPPHNLTTNLTSGMAMERIGDIVGRLVEHDPDGTIATARGISMPPSTEDSTPKGEQQ